MGLYLRNIDGIEVDLKTLASPSHGHAVRIGNDNPEIVADVVLMLGINIGNAGRNREKKMELAILARRLDLLPLPPERDRRKTQIRLHGHQFLSLTSGLGIGCRIMVKEP